MIKNKRGSHVGRILSFIIFIVFFVYFYSLLAPEVIMQRDKEYLLNYLESEIKQNITGEVNSITLRIEDESNSDQKCVLLDNLLGIINNEKITIKNENEENLSVFREIGTNNTFLLRKDNENLFFRIYSSDSFEELEERVFPLPPIITSEVTCTPVTPRLQPEDNYTIHRATRTRAILFSLYIELLEEYNLNYYNLKEDFNFPEKNNFGFGIELENSTIIETPDRNIADQVYVQRIPIEYYSEELKREQGFLIIRVW